jgi:hypothetical protein
MLHATRTGISKSARSINVVESASADEVPPFNMDIDELLVRAESSFYASGLPGCVGATDGSGVITKVRRDRLSRAGPGPNQ